MELYLVQHGEAKPEEDDPERPLTDRGRETVQQTAAFAAKARLQVSQIRHSGKCRAQQTAEILGEKLSPERGVVATSGLAPKDDVAPCAQALQAETEPLMIVGHLPFLARLASLLLAGDEERSVIRFQNAGLVCLTRDEDGWSAEWIVTPGLLC